MNGFVKSGLTLALTLCGCGTAYAHAHLLQSAPAAGMVVTAAPGVLRLDFRKACSLGSPGSPCAARAVPSSPRATPGLHRTTTRSCLCLCRGR